MTPEIDMTDPALDLILQLAALDRQVETAELERNTPNGSRRLEQLLEERDGLRDDLNTAAPQPPEQRLVDARFLEQTDLDADGAVIGYTVQAAERFRDVDGQLVGRILDIGHYVDAHTAGDTYEALQESLREGEITTRDIGALGEALATENGLDPHGWRAMDAADTLRFTNAQAREALHDIGLEVTDTFDLHRDTLSDPATGERALCSVFQIDDRDPTQGCQPLLITLSESDPDAGFAAQAVAFGTAGDLASAETARESVHHLLESGGLEEALQFAETLTPPEPSLPAWSRDIA